MMDDKPPKLFAPPSFFAALGQPSCSRWAKSEIEWLALAYVQALANGGDTWKRLTKQQVWELLTPEQQRISSVKWLLTDDYYDLWFQRVQAQLTDSTGAFDVGGFWSLQSAKSRMRNGQ